MTEHALNHQLEQWKSGTGYLNLDGFKVCLLKGNDRADYLNRRVSQLVLNLPEGAGRRAFILDGVGKIEDDLEVFEWSEENAFLLFAPTYRADRLPLDVDKYIFTEECEVEDWEEITSIAVYTESTLLENKQFAVLENELLCFKSDILGGAHVFIQKGSGDILNAVEKVLNQKLESISMDAFHDWRVEQGITFYGADITEATIPLEANLTRGIHFDKGCYPGQETIATIINLGHPSKKFVCVELEGHDVEIGSELMSAEGKSVGAVTTLHSDQTKAIGRVKWRYRESGTELSLGSGKAIVRCEVEDCDSK